MLAWRHPKNNATRLSAAAVCLSRRFPTDGPRPQLFRAGRQRWLFSLSPLSSPSSCDMIDLPLTFFRLPITGYGMVAALFLTPNN